MIRSAKMVDSQALTEISFTSKGYWNYPKEYFEIWKDELTISPEYILKNEVFVYEIDKAIVGYYSVVELKEDIKNSGIRIGKGFFRVHAHEIRRFYIFPCKSEKRLDLLGGD
jgi:hypothetical protein